MVAIFLKDTPSMGDLWTTRLIQLLQNSIIFLMYLVDLPPFIVRSEIRVRSNDDIFLIEVPIALV